MFFFVCYSPTRQFPSTDSARCDHHRLRLCRHHHHPSHHPHLFHLSATPSQRYAGCFVVDPWCVLYLLMGCLVVVDVIVVEVLLVLLMFLLMGCFVFET